MYAQVRNMFQSQRDAHTLEVHHFLMLAARSRWSHPQDTRTLKSAMSLSQSRHQDDHTLK